MVVLRATAKVRRILPESATSESISDAALGDWYVNRVVIDRRPLLLIVSATSLLPLVTPAREVRSLPERFTGLVAQRLERLGVAAHLAEAELAAMTPAVVAKTTDRSVLGIMVDFAKAMPFYFASCGHESSGIWEVEAILAKTPCHAGRSREEVVFPYRKAAELLTAKWAAV